MCHLPHRHIGHTGFHIDEIQISVTLCALYCFLCVYVFQFFLNNNSLLRLADWPALFFCLCRSIDAKQVIGLFTEMVIKQEGRKDDAGNKRQHDQQLNPGCFLNILFGLNSTNLTRTVLHLFLKKQGIKFAAQANPKCRFKKQEDQADETDNARNRAVGIYNDQEDKHDRGEDHANDPGKFLLRSPHIFRCLVAHNQACNNQGRSVFRIYKNTDEKINQENAEHIFDQEKIVFKNDQH